VFSKENPNFEICQMFHDGTDLNEVGEANARLASAAPDFYAAATKLLAAFDELQSTTTAERIITGRSDAALRRDSNAAIAELRAAIAKAEGR
jgi:hypothetical protein